MELSSDSSTKSEQIIQLIILTVKSENVILNVEPRLPQFSPEFTAAKSIQFQQCSSIMKIIKDGGSEYLSVMVH